jgi:CheY-like chemotaxis protein
MHEEFSHGERPALDRPPAAAGKPPVNFSLVMVVTSSPVNRVVVSRIVERAGLKVVACAAEEASDMLQRTMPCVVVTEEGLLDRERSAAGLPLVIALSRPGSTSAECRSDCDADAIVAMPITPDGLAPVVLRLVERARGLSSS